MLAPVSQTTQISPTSSDLRAANVDAGKASVAAAANQPAAPTLPLPVALSSAAIEQLKKLILSNGNVGQDVMAKLADMIARSLKIERLPGEKQDVFYARLSTAIEKLKPEERLLTEMRTGLKTLTISLADFGRALLDPAGPQAARLIAQAEVSTGNLDRQQQTAITDSYLDDGAGPHRSMETLQAKMAAQASADGQNFFAADYQPDSEPVMADAKQLQSVLQQAYDDNAAIVLPEPATSLTEILADPVTMALINLPDLPETAEEHAQAIFPETPALPGKPQLRLEPLKVMRETLGQLANQLARESAPEGMAVRNAPAFGKPADAAIASSPADQMRKTVAILPDALIPVREIKTPDAQIHLAHGDRPAILDRKPTMMLLRGMTEVVTQLADKAVESIKAFVEQIPEAKPFPEKLVNGQPHQDRAAVLVTDLSSRDMIKARVILDGEVSGKTGANALPLPKNDIEDDMSSQTRADDNWQSTPLRSSEPEDRESIRQAFREPLPVPYAFVPYPIEDESKKPARQKARARSDDGEATEQETDDQAASDDQRREEQPSEPNNEDVDAAELAPLGRNATDADRAFRHYQRMSGF